MWTYENRVIKPVKIILKSEEGDESTREMKFDQSTCYTFIEISPFVQLVYANKKGGSL
jgi:hypothetical protein